jgi:hypothetical protein
MARSWDREKVEQAKRGTVNVLVRAMEWRRL